MDLVESKRHDASRRAILVYAMGAAIVAATGSSSASPRLPCEMEGETVRLWPGAAPGGPSAMVDEQVVDRSTDPARYRHRLYAHVQNPEITVVRPAQPSGGAVLIVPGGGYSVIAIDKEGFEIASALATFGVTSFILKYRLPGDGWSSSANVPLQDGQRAMRLIRANADRFNIDPARLGILGFSAGGHLAGSVAYRGDANVYAAVDEADGHSSRPAFAALIYPVVTLRSEFAHAGSRAQLLGRHNSEARAIAYSLETLVQPGAPATFLVHAFDDASVPVENSLRLASALRSHHVPLEAHLFEIGGHGFGLGLSMGKPCEAWPGMFTAWARKRGL